MIKEAELISSEGLEATLLAAAKANSRTSLIDSLSGLVTLKLSLIYYGLQSGAYS